MALGVTIDSRVPWTLPRPLSPPQSLSDPSFCPGTWDGWLCWPDTPAGKSAYAPCPTFVTGFDPNSTYPSLALMLRCPLFGWQVALFTRLSLAREFISTSHAR